MGYIWSKRGSRGKKKQKEAEIAASKSKCYDLQMLKFGQTIDLDALDKMTVSKSIDDVKAKIDEQEVRNNNQIQSVLKGQRSLNEDLVTQTQENTELLENIATLSNEQFTLEKELNSSVSGVHVADQGPSLKKEVEERNRLIQLVKLQAKEVDALKAEINMLRRKGGHIYTPAVRPPLPPDQTV